MIKRVQNVREFEADNKDSPRFGPRAKGPKSSSLSVMDSALMPGFQAKMGRMYCTRCHTWPLLWMAPNDQFWTCKQEKLQPFLRR